MSNLRPTGHGWAAQSWILCDCLTLRTGSFSQTGITVTLTTATAHNLVAGMGVYLNITAGTGTPPPTGYYTVVSTPTSLTFTVTAASSTATGSFNSQLTVKDSYNVASAQRMSQGKVKVTFETVFSGTSYLSAPASDVIATITIDSLTKAANSCILQLNGSSGFVDSANLSSAFIGR